MLKKGCHGYVINIMVKTALSHPKSASIKLTVKYVYKVTLNKATFIKGWDKKLIKYKKIIQSK